MNKIGVVIPACNEEAYIERCLLALKAQFEFYQYLGSSENIPEIKILVVLDSCTDQTAIKAVQLGIEVISCNFRSVGKTRHLEFKK